MVGHQHNPEASPVTGTASGFFSRLLDNDFVPRAQCFNLDQGVIWLHVISDVIITAAYYSIPIALVYFVRRRRDLAFNWMFLMFAVFILACGTTHLFNIVAIWNPVYRLDGIVKALTATASIGTAIALWPLIPRAVALPSPTQLRIANTSLEGEVKRRSAAEEELRAAHAALERKIKERTDELARSEARYRSLVEATAQIVWARPPDGSVSEDLPSWRAFTGQTADQLLGWGWLDALHPDDRERARTAWRAALERQQPLELEYRLRRADGEYRTTVVRAVPVREADGSIREWVGMNTDVTELRRVEDAIRESEGRLRAIVETAVDAILTIDERGRIGSFNPAAERIFGYTADEVLGKNVSMLMPEPYRGEHDSYLRNYTTTGERKIIGIGREVQGRRKDGSVFPMDLAVSETRLGDRRIFTGIVRDITDRKRAEEALARHRDHLEDLVAERTRALEESYTRLRHSERLAGLGTLSAGLGHDLGNLLLPVKVRLETLAARVPEDLRDDIISIQESTRYLGQLASGLRLLARDPESAPLTETTDLAEWWADVQTLLRNPLPRAVELRGRIPADLPPARIGRAALAQAIFNLVQNAGDVLQATGRGAVDVWAEATTDQQWIRIGVTDDGPGMTEEVRSRCLEPFFTTKSRGISTGLGLSLVQGIVQRAGGSISIQSRPGEGATFTLLIPAASRPTNNGPAPLAAVTVSDPRIGSFIREILSSQGFSITSTDPPGPSALLWVADSRADPSTIREFLAADPRRRALIHGPAPADLDGPRLAAVQGAFQPTALRDRIVAMARDLLSDR